MQQSSVIFFFLFAAYFVFITVRGELPVYMGLLLASPKSTGPAPAPVKTADSGGTSDAAKIAQMAAKVAPYLL